MNAGTFRANASAVYLVNDWIYNGGNFNPGTSTFTFGGNNTLTGSTTFYNLNFNGTAVTYTIAATSTITVTGLFTFTTSNINAGSGLNGGTLELKGDFSHSVGAGGTTTFLIDGTGTQNWTYAGDDNTPTGMSNIVINKTAGTLNFSGGSMRLYNWTNNNAGGSFNAVVGSTVHFYSASTLTGSTTFYNLKFGSNAQAFTIASGSTFTAAGLLSLGDGGNFEYVNGGALAAAGDVFLPANSAGGSAQLLFVGSNTQNYYNTTGATNLSGTWTVNKTGGQVNLNNDLTINSGGTQILNVAAGTINLNNYNLNVSTLVAGASGNVQLNGNETMTILSTTIIAGSSFTYVGTMSTQTIKNFAYSNLTINGGASTEFYFPANLTTINNLTISAGLLNLGGYNLTAAAISNIGTVRRIGSETVTITGGNDTDSGAWEYMGNGDGSTNNYTIKEFLHDILIYLDMVQRRLKQIQVHYHYMD
jgi:hypothetical protein